jgi:hypothetical protein
MAKLKPKRTPNESVDLSTINSKNIVDKVAAYTGLPTDMVGRILLFLNFALHTKDGSLTKFAKVYGITDYKSLYKFLKETKQLYKNDHEIEAFSNRYNTLFKSVQPRAAAWIFNTFVKFDNEKEDKDKYITANLYAASFTNRTFGQLMENLRLFDKVVKAMDKVSGEVDKFAESMNYSPEKGD